MLNSSVSRLLLRALATALSPQGRKAKLLILAYHRVLPESDALTGCSLDRITFDWHMRVIKEQFNVLPLVEAADRLAKNSLPNRALCVTFDDGYRDNYTDALPILKKYSIPATVFVAPGFLDGGIMWNDMVIETIRSLKDKTIDVENLKVVDAEHLDIVKKQNLLNEVLNKLKYFPYQQRLENVKRLIDESEVILPTDLMLSNDELKRLHADNIEIGAHTMTHPILSKISNQMAADEISESKNKLIEILDDKITAFAYPNGIPNVDYNSDHVEIVRKAGFQVAVSTAWGNASCNADLLQLPRIGSWDATEFRFNARMIKSYFNNVTEFA